MSKIWGHVYPLQPGDVIPVQIPVGTVHGVTFENNSGSFLLLRVGGANVPSSQAGADETLPPYTSLSFPTNVYIFGVSVVANLQGLSIPSTISEGVLTVTAYNEAIQRHSEQLVGAPTNIAPLYVPDVFPYTNLGESLSASGAYTTFDATGYGVLRFHVQNFADTPARFSIQITTQNNVSSVNEQHLFVIGPRRAGVQSFPLRRIATGGVDSIVVLPTLFVDATNIQPVTLTPVLTQSGDVWSDIPSEGAYQKLFNRKDLNAGVPVRLINGPIWLMWAKQNYNQANPSPGTGFTPILCILQMNSGMTIEGYKFVEHTTGIALNSEEWGPVPFQTAHFVPASDCVAIKCTDTVDKVDSWLGYTF